MWGSVAVESLLTMLVELDFFQGFPQSHEKLQNQLNLQQSRSSLNSRVFQLEHQWLLLLKFNKICFKLLLIFTYLYLGSISGKIKMGWFSCVIPRKKISRLKIVLNLLLVLLPFNKE